MGNCTYQDGQKYFFFVLFSYQKIATKGNKIKINRRYVFDLIHGSLIMYNCNPCPEIVIYYNVSLRTIVDTFNYGHDS